jgi:hypothetical protein
MFFVEVCIALFLYQIPAFLCALTKSEQYTLQQKKLEDKNLIQKQSSTHFNKTHKKAGIRYKNRAMHTSTKNIRRQESDTKTEQCTFQQKHIRRQDSDTKQSNTHFNKNK